MILSEKELLKELFAMPVNPSLVADIDGSLKLYSSDSLVSKYKKTLSTNKYTASSFDKLNKLVDKQSITPVYLTKGLLSYSFSKVFGNKMDGVNAFYSPHKDRIFILVENNTTFGFANDKWIGKLTIHECMHMAALHGKKKFLKLFYNEYAHFYNVFFHLLGNKKNITKESSAKIATLVDEYISLFFKFESSEKSPNKVIDEGEKIVYRILLKLDVPVNVAQLLKESYITLLKLYINKGWDGIIKAFNLPTCKYILICLSKTYAEISNHKINSLVIQELIYPSEIAAIFSEMNISPSNVKKAINMIKV